MLALSDEDIRNKLIENRKQQKQKIIEKDSKVKQRG
jgi:phosphoribosylcarboxyaminoimidazole (NCAIR) mutase